jgi:hypothetical protein
VKRGARIVAALVALASTACTVQTERETVLPWLMKKSTYRAFGNFSGSTSTTYYARHWGLWRSLEGWGVTVLDAEHALVRDAQGVGILRKGSLTPVRACGLYGVLTIPPASGAVDCVEGSGHGPGGLTQIRVRRLAFDGEILDERTVSAPGETRIFQGPARAVAYDDDANAYFLVMDAEAARDSRIRPTACALVTRIGAGEPRVIEGAGDMSWQQCVQPASWEIAAERRLRPAE